jgi:hypothetical protein
MKELTIKWEGISGEKYTYGIFPLDTLFNDIPGNYIFVKKTKSGFHKPLYIGQSISLEKRPDGHGKETCAKINGATHVHAHENINIFNRLAEEKDLILKWQPVCNNYRAN